MATFGDDIADNGISSCKNVDANQFILGLRITAHKQSWTALRPMQAVALDACEGGAQLKAQRRATESFTIGIAAGF